MEQIGLVKRIFDDKAELEVRRASACGNCKGCAGSCDVQAHIITIKNTANAKMGDFVELKGDAKIIIRYMFIIYMIPFVFLVAGIALSNNYFKSMGYANFELMSFGVGLFFLTISFFIIRFIDSKIAKSNKSTIIMTKIL